MLTTRSTVNSPSLCLGCGYVEECPYLLEWQLHIQVLGVVEHQVGDLLSKSSEKKNIARILQLFCRFGIILNKKKKQQRKKRKKKSQHTTIQCGFCCCYPSGVLLFLSLGNLSPLMYINISNTKICIEL